MYGIYPSYVLYRLSTKMLKQKWCILQLNRRWPKEYNRIKHWFNKKRKKKNISEWCVGILHDVPIISIIAYHWIRICAMFGCTLIPYKLYFFSNVCSAPECVCVCVRVRARESDTIKMVFYPISWWCDACGDTYHWGVICFVIQNECRVFLQC